MSELPDFLSDGPQATSEPTPATEPAAQPEPQPTPEAEGQLRDASGRFASAEPAAQPGPEPQPQPEAQPAPTPDPPQVPLATLLEVREKLTNSERELRDLRQWREQQEAQSRRQPIPNRDEDPEAYEAHQQAMFEGSIFMMRRDMSRRLAVVEHGKQTVDAAYDWAATRIDEELRANEQRTGRRFSPLNDQVLASDDPVGVVLQEWRRDQVASKVDPNDYEAYLAWKAAGGATATPATPAAPAAIPTPPAAPRPSLASGPSAGAHSQAVPADGEEQFNRMFG